MRKEQQSIIVEAVTDHYLNKRQFNGLPLAALRKKYSLTKRDIKILVESGDIEIHFGFGHPNAHIKALPLGDIGTLLKTLDFADAQRLWYSVLYPTAKHLKEVVKPSDYESRPFSLMLALGTPQLELLAFDPQVLKTYRDDPRYTYDYSGVVGRISLADHDETMLESERVIVETFGMGFSKDYENDAKTCVIGVPYYLHKLTPEHQMLWKHRCMDMTEYDPEYGFVKSQIIGDWDFDTTMYEAFKVELEIINKMAIAIEGVRLFKKDYTDGTNPPRNFHRLLMPTKREYQEFVETLDKLMSDNLNRNFFKNRMAISFGDTQMGTIALLEEYFNRFMTARDRSPVDEMLKTFRKVRSERSKSSHHALEDEFTYTYNHKQRDIMRQAYTAIRLIRLALTNAPDAKDVKVPGWLYKGEIGPQ